MDIGSIAREMRRGNLEQILTEKEQARLLNTKEAEQSDKIAGVHNNRAWTILLRGLQTQNFNAAGAADGLFGSYADGQRTTFEQEKTATQRDVQLLMEGLRRISQQDDQLRQLVREALRSLVELRKVK